MGEQDWLFNESMYDKISPLEENFEEYEVLDDDWFGEIIIMNSIENDQI